jgi:penicillin-binding protein 1A
VLFLLGVVAFAFGLVTAVAGQIPQYDPAHQRSLAVNSVIYDSTGNRVLAVLRGRESRTIVPSSRISPLVKQAIVAIEDQRFYEHRGVDVRGIARAVWADIRSNRVVQGGSTITQQFVKNAIVTSEQSITRKLKEAALAWQLEQRWSKDRILTAYLNTIYFANGAWGIAQASETYFGKRPLDLNLAEAALLAGIPQDPSLYDPVANPRAARARRHEVLQALLAQHEITWGDYVRANRTPMPAPDSVRTPGTRGPAPYFANYVKDQLVERYGSSRVFGGGLKVRTTIDLRLQQVAQDAIAKWLPGEEGPAAALVALDPRDGRVLAMVGGRSERKSQFYLAVQCERQPG